MIPFVPAKAGSPLSRQTEFSDHDNPHGNRHHTRHLLNQEFMQALLLNFRHQGKKAIEKVASGV
jgi:hypothetical protein